MFGRNVKGQRKRRKSHQVELARRAHPKAKTIREIERGLTNARLSTVEAIALAFQVGPSELLKRLSAKGKTLVREEVNFIGEVDGTGSIMAATSCGPSGGERAVSLDPAEPVTVRTRPADA